MDGVHAIDSAAMPRQRCALVSRVLFFAAVLLGFLLLGMASAGAEEDGQRDTSAAQDSSRTDNDTPRDESASESEGGPSETSPKPEKKSQGEEPKNTDRPDEGKSESPLESESEPVEPTTPESPSGTRDEGESGSTEGNPPDSSPVADAVDETTKNANELVLDKPEKLARAADETVRNTSKALTSEDAADRSLHNVTKTASGPLLRETKTTVEDTVELTRRQVGVVRRTASGVNRHLQGLSDELSNDLDGVVGHKPDQQPVPGSNGLDSDPASSQRVPLKAPEVADVPSRKMSSQTSQVSKGLEPSPYAAERAATTKHAVVAQEADAAPEPLDNAPVVGGASASSDSTGISAAACVIESFVMRLGGGHQVVAAPSVLAPRTVSLQPGFAPD